MFVVDNNEIDSAIGLINDVSIGKALIIDPIDTDRYSLKQILEHLSYQVITPAENDDLMQLVQDEQPAIIFYYVESSLEAEEHILRNLKAFKLQTLVNPYIILILSGDNPLEIASSDSNTLFDDICIRPILDISVTARLNNWKRIQGMEQLLNIQSSRLSEYSTQINQEMELAQNIIHNQLKRQDTEPGNVNQFSVPMDILSGDVFLNTQKPNGNQVFLIGDLTGHGLPAAVGAMVVFDVFYTMSAKGFLLEEIAMELNKKLNKLNETGRFMCAALIELDLENTFMHVINSGLPDVIVTAEDKGIKEQFKSKNLPFGILANKEYSIKLDRLNLDEGDKIFVYTDGFSEISNKHGEYLGTERINKLIDSNRKHKNMYTELLDLMYQFQHGHKPTDDITLVEIICDKNLLKEQVKVKRNVNKPSMQWSLEFEMSASVLKNDNFLPLLLQNVIDIQGLQPYREQIYTIMAEMYSNALEHGMLNLESSLKSGTDGFANYYGLREKRLADLDHGFIKIELNNEPIRSGGELIISIEHSGSSFDFETYLENIQKDNNQAHGRGIMLLQKLCSDIKYSKQGRKLQVSYQWQHEQD